MLRSESFFVSLNFPRRSFVDVYELSVDPNTFVMGSYRRFKFTVIFFLIPSPNIFSFVIMLISELYPAFSDIGDHMCKCLNAACVGVARGEGRANLEGGHAHSCTFRQI